MRRMVRCGLAALLLGLACAARTPTAQLGLRPSFGGALLVGRITAGADEELTGVWSDVGRARLLRCAPRCEGAKTIPVDGTLVLSGDTAYRVAIGGEFRVGQHVRLALRFRNMQVLNVDAAVTRP